MFLMVVKCLKMGSQNQMAFPAASTSQRDAFTIVLSDVNLVVAEGGDLSGLCWNSSGGVSEGPVVVEAGCQTDVVLSVVSVPMLRLEDVSRQSPVGRIKDGSLAEGFSAHDLTVSKSLDSGSEDETGNPTSPVGGGVTGGITVDVDVSQPERDENSNDVLDVVGGGEVPSRSVPGNLNASRSRASTVVSTAFLICSVSDEMHVLTRLTLLNCFA